MSSTTVLVHVLPVFPLNHGALPDCSACQPVFPLIHPSLPPEVSITQGMIKSLPSLNSCPGVCKIKGTFPPHDTQDCHLVSPTPQPCLSTMQLQSSLTKKNQLLQKCSVFSHIIAKKDLCYITLLSKFLCVLQFELSHKALPHHHLLAELSLFPWCSSELSSYPELHYLWSAFSMHFFDTGL